MRIQSTRPIALPKLPEIPAKGRGTHVTEPVDYTAPDTVETRLGSIPKNYETGTGSSRSTRSISFENGVKEAANKYGRSRDIWRPQPTFTQDGQVKMKQVTESIEVEYRNPLAEGIGKGLLGAGLVGFFGLWAGTVASIFSGRPEPMLLGGVGGALTGGLIAGVGSYRDAAAESVHLEWQKTDVAEYDLSGYTYRIDEDEDCTGTGDDRRCDSDYEHIFRPIVGQTSHGEYYRPVVVRSNS
jgi:hypothetical protein